MKIKRKRPVFSAIVLRVIEARFKEIAQVNMVSDTVFELVLRPGTYITEFMAGFDRHMVQVVAEFGDPDVGYIFRFASGALCGELCYGEINNTYETDVNGYRKQQYGS